MPFEVGEEPLRSVRISHEMRIERPAAAVFEALTGDIGEWFWRGAGNDLPKVTLEAVLGGRFYRPSPEGEGGDLYATVTEFTRPRRLQLHGSIGGELAIVSLITITLEEAGSATVLKLSHRLAGEVPQAEVESYDEGWADELQSLKRFLETGKGRGA